MTDVSFVDLLVRMVVSLAIVLGLMFGAYVFLRRRQGFGPVARPGGGRSLLARGRSGAGGSRRGVLGGKGGLGGIGGALGGASLTRATASRTAGNRRGLRVLGRVGVGRTTQVVAVQFADKVFLLAASDQAAPSVLAELPYDAWNAATESLDDDPTVTRVPVTREPLDQASARPTGLLDSLREATTRRG